MALLDDLVFQLVTDEVVTSGVVYESTKAVIPAFIGSGTLHLVETGGSGPEFVQNAVTPSFVLPTAQLTARHRNADIARNLAEKAFYSLVAVRNQFINGNWYRRIRMLQSQPVDRGVDARGEIRFSFNIVADYNRRENL